MIEYDDEDSCLLNPAFPVGDLSKFDPNKAPTSGKEYLQHVHMESKKCPQVVVAKLDRLKISKKTKKYTAGDGFMPAPPGLAPDSKLVTEQVMAFSTLRVELKTKQNKIKDQLPPIVFPDVNDTMAWCEYSLGTEVRKKVEKMSKRNANVSTTEEKKPEATDKEVSPMKCQEEVHEGQEPLLSVMLHLSHSTIEKLLAYHLDWLELAGFSSKQGRWIFSLMALLPKPLSPKTCDLLRSLARMCAAMRADLKMSSVDEKLLGLNHIISLVTSYFDQKEICDNIIENSVGQLVGKALVVNEDVEITDEEEEPEGTGSEDEENNQE